MPGIDRYLISSMSLIGLAVLFLAVITVTDRRDITSASVIISATTLFLTGVLLYAFSKRESLDERFVSLLSVQGTINLSRVAADLGISGSACFLPPPRTGQPDVMQFMPVTSYAGGTISGDSFVTGQGGTGLLVQPAGRALLSHLKKSQIFIPTDRQGLAILITEIAEDVLEIADAVRVAFEDDSVRIRVDEYRLIVGCRETCHESPACCTMNPCFFCSLLAVCIVEGLDRPVMIDRCMPDLRHNTVEIIMSILP